MDVQPLSLYRLSYQLAPVNSGWSVAWRGRSNDNTAVQIVRKFLDEHAAAWHQIAPRLIAEALNKSYPCP